MHRQAKQLARVTQLRYPTINMGNRDTRLWVQAGASGNYPAHPHLSVLLSKCVPDSGFHRLDKKFVKHQGLYLWRGLGKEPEAAGGGAISLPFGRKWLVSKMPPKSEQSACLH